MFVVSASAIKTFISMDPKVTSKKPITAFFELLSNVKERKFHLRTLACNSAFLTLIYISGKFPFTFPQFYHLRHNAMCVDLNVFLQIY